MKDDTMQAIVDVGEAFKGARANLAAFERERDNVQRRWVESVKGQTVDKAAREVHAQRGEALMVWIDPSGELRAMRICRETSRIREFIPDYLLRSPK